MLLTHHFHLFAVGIVGRRWLRLDHILIDRAGSIGLLDLQLPHNSTMVSVLSIFGGSELGRHHI